MILIICVESLQIWNKVICKRRKGSIRISKSESVIYELDEDGVFTYNGKEVLEHAKTDAGERDIPYTTYAKQIIQMIE